MIRSCGGHYLVSRAAVHIVFAVVVVLGASVLFLPLHLLLSVAARFLDVEAPLTAAQAVVLFSRDRDTPDDRARTEVARLVKSGEVRLVFLVGPPFTPDELEPAVESPWARGLRRAGVPSDALVELYGGRDLAEQLALVRDAAQDRGVKSVLILSNPASARRRLSAARRVLGPAVMELGLRAIHRDFDAARLREDRQARELVVNESIRLLHGWLTGRYGLLTL